MLAAAAVAALVAGGTIAVVAATSEDNNASPGRGAAASGNGQERQIGRRGDLTVAARYLGLTTSKLLGGLRSGQTLAQLADSMRGRSANGLIERILAVRKATLAKAVASGQLTAAQEKVALASLRDRITVRVNRVGGYTAAAGTRALRAPAATAAYLGISQQQLRNELRSGRTLAQLANGIRGKSSRGLIAAIIADTRARLAAAVAAGSLTPKGEKQLLAPLNRRIANEVNGR
jgi:hypothetical protein